MGKKKQLVISRKLSLVEIKEAVLKKERDLSEKFVVIPPAKLEKK